MDELKYSTTKVLAIYLPQYHETEFNNKYWGKGYTEWTACKDAKPLFPGHKQPRVPYEYYDLSNYKAIDKQANLAREYGIDGFAIYQYYSCGNKLLEKPTELLLKHKEIDISYCLYWANESWENRWYGQEAKVIWEQKYGGEEEWEKQFYYCLNFFDDERYIKIENKPVYIIYKDWNFKSVYKFIDCWNKLAKENGFDGIYFIKTVAAGNTDNPGIFNASFEREPFYTLTHNLPLIPRYYRYFRTRIVEKLNKAVLMKKGKGIIQYKMDYDYCCSRIENHKLPYGSRTIPGLFTDWDNSPRRQFNCTMFSNVTTERFEKCFDIQYQKATKYGCPFVIINAWKEWGEGNYLEPDELYGDSFLKAIKQVKQRRG